MLRRDFLWSILCHDPRNERRTELSYKCVVGEFCAETKTGNESISEASACEFNVLVGVIQKQRFFFNSAPKSGL